MASSHADDLHECLLLVVTAAVAAGCEGYRHLACRHDGYLLGATWVGRSDSRGQ